MTDVAFEYIISVIINDIVAFFTKAIYIYIFFYISHVKSSEIRNRGF